MPSLNPLGQRDHVMLPRFTDTIGAPVCRLAQTSGPHIGPVCVHVGHAFGLGAGRDNRGPASRNRQSGRPKRVLALAVCEYREDIAVYCEIVVFFVHDWLSPFLESEPGIG